MTLLSSRRITHVARALALNPTTLARWASLAESDTSTPCTEPSPDPDAFVPLTLSDEPPSVGQAPRTEPSASAAAELIVRWPHGTQLTVNGSIPTDTLGAILAAAATVANTP